MGSANSERKDMRRKLFFVTVILIALLYIIDGAGLPLRKGINDQWPGEQDYIASVIRRNRKRKNTSCCRNFRWRLPGKACTYNLPEF